MVQITAEMVKKLREMTDAGMMDCKKALVENSGDMDASVEWLRKKGLSAAAKKSGRIATEGAVMVEISDDHKSATISEINSETDFVAQNDNFQAFAKGATKHIHCTKPDSVEDLLRTEIEGTKFEEYLKAQIAKIGENIVIRRFSRITVAEGGTVAGYVHSNGKIGVIVAAKCDSEKTCEAVNETLRDIAMHIAAMNPKYLDASTIPAEVIEKEKEIGREQLKKEGKPENIWDKILDGKIRKFCEENTVLGQKFVKDDKRSVEQVLSDAAKRAGGTARIVEFVRFELGEGLEKKGCDFAAEVAAQLGR